MGLDINENIKKVATSYGNYERNQGNVDGAFVKNGHQLQLGYVLSNEEGVLGIVGDFWSTGLSAETFMGQLGQIYTEIAIQQQLELQGYTVDQVYTDVNGDTIVEAYMWA